MIRVRRVDDVAIIDWSHKDVATVVPRIRALVDAREASRVLLNMREVDSLKGEGLETLTEALSVCEDKGCTLAMYGLNTYLTKLLDIMGLHAVMPTIVGAEEGEAIDAVRAMQADGAVLEAELDFESQEAKDGGAARQASSSDETVVEFEFDAPEAKPATKALGKAGQAPMPAAMPPTIKFDKAAVAATEEEAGSPDDDLLALSWVDVAAQGIRIGGPGARDIISRLDADAGSKTQPLSGPLVDRAAAARPTAKLPPAASGGNELEIDIEEVAPEKPAAGKPVKPREYKTEVIQAFEIRSEKPVETTDDSENLEVDFEPVSADQVGLGQPAGFMQGGDAPALFGGQDTESSEWSPVDTEPRRPAAPPAAARLPGQPPQPARPTQAAPPPTPRPATPARSASPVQPAQPARPAAAAPAARAPQAPPQQPPHPAPQHPAPQQPAQHAQPQPAQPSQPTQQQPQPAPAPGYGGMDAGDETVMFQADGLLAEVLAAVSSEATAAAPAPAAANGEQPTAVLSGPPMPLPTQAPAPAASAAPAPSSAKTEPTAASAGGAKDGAGGETAELRGFLSDYALVTELHLRVLDKFSREGIEKVVGRPEVQSAVGGSAAAISSILEDFVQARLLRRRRSPRIRGGTGFLYTPSPKTRNAVTRLLRRYEDGSTRSEVMSWVTAARKANEK